MLLADVVATSATVAATRSRKAKVAAIAGLLAVAPPDEIETVTAYVGGALRQRRTGVGWRGLTSLPDPAAEPSLTVLGVHAAFDALAALAGPGSQAARGHCGVALLEHHLLGDVQEVRPGSGVRCSDSSRARHANTLPLPDRTC